MLFVLVFINMFGDGDMCCRDGVFMKMCCSFYFDGVFYSIRSYGLDKEIGIGLFYFW